MSGHTAEGHGRSGGSTLDSSNNNNNQSSSSGSSSGHSNNQFTVLLSTMMELRSDLEKTVVKLQEMEQQNENLTRNYDLVKGELIETRKKYNEIKENYNAAVKDRIDNEKKYENLINSIKSQLSDRTREFEKQKEILKPKDIDSIRIKVQEELEIPHKLKLQAVISEMDQYKASMFETRKNYEVEVTSLKSENQSAKDTIDFLNKKCEAIQQSLRDQISDLQTKLFNIENDDKTRSLSVRIHELEYSLATTKTALIDAQSERDKALIENEKLRNAAERMAIDFKTKLATIEVDLVGAKEKISILSKERDYKEGAFKSNCASLEESNARLEAKDRELNDMKDKFNILKDNHDRERQMMEGRFNKELDDNNHIQKNLQLKLVSRDESIKKLQKDISDIQLRAEAELIELRRSSSRQSQEFNARILANELEISSLKGTITTNETKLNQLNHKLEAESTSVNSEKALMKREKDIVSQKLTESSIEVRALKEQISSIESDKENIQSKLLEKDNEIAKLRSAEASLRAQLERSHLDAVEVENRTQKLIEAVRSETKEKLISMQDAVRMRLLSTTEKAEKAIQHEKQRSEAYKKKALSVYERYKTAVGSKSISGGYA